METDILENPVDIGLFGIIGIMMKSKNFTNLIQQKHSFRCVLPCLNNIRVSLFLASFTPLLS